MLQTTFRTWITSIILVLFFTGCGPASKPDDGNPATQQPHTPSITLSASASSIPYEGMVTLSWTSSEVFDCNAVGDWAGPKSASGQENIDSLLVSSTFQMVCDSTSGLVSDSVTVNVESSSTPALTFSASPDNVPYNGSSTLEWSSSNVSECLATGDWSGSKNLSGSRTFSSLTTDQTFTLDCSGTNGSISQTVTVQVAAPGAPSVSLTASPTSVAYNGSTQLTWTSENVETCLASGNWSGSKNLSGSKTKSSLTSDQIYTLTCTGAGGTTSSTVNVSVADPVPEVSLTASPSVVADNGSTTLIWSSSNTTSCTASGDWSGDQSTSGTQTISGITADSTFGITCSGSGGSSTKTVTVRISNNPGGDTDNSNCTDIIPNGTYSTNINANSYPSSSLVCAETDGQVIFTGSFSPSGYDMKGFVVASNNSKSISNGTFERMSFVGGPACGNDVNTDVGANTIIRDSVFYGEGGRYLLLAYQTSGVQIINAIFRVDGGWGETSGCNEYEPNAAINIYDSNSSVCDGCINIDTRVTAQSNSETLGGLGINAHSTNRCYDVEIRNSIEFNSDGFWADGNGSCNTQYTNDKGNMSFNLKGTAMITDSSGSECNSWTGSVDSLDSNFSGGNCSSNGSGANITLDQNFLDDPRWKAEMCGGFSSRTDGWCDTQMSLSEYISQ